MARRKRLIPLLSASIFFVVLFLIVTRHVSHGNGESGEMVYIPAGKFVMGTDGENDGGLKSVFGEETDFQDPQSRREVYVDGFTIDKYEVTNRQYKRFVDETRYHRLPDHWEDGKIPPGEEDQPVTFVSWYDTQAYAKWAGKRLPTEVEWEKAARGTDGRRFPWGMEFARDKANTWESWGGRTGRAMQVGRHKEGQSPYGVHDMAGNVMEWTGTTIKRYARSRSGDGQEETLPLILVRGGAWSSDAKDAQTFSRVVTEPYIRSGGVGFRCAK